jgi:uncharacterized repeat protein (TIGR02059 family)
VRVRNTLLLLLFFLSPTISGTTYYISTTGSDSNTGTSSSPWKSLSYACSKALVSGDIIHVNAGTYIESAQSKLAAGVSIEGAGNTSIIHSTITSSGIYTIFLPSTAEGTNGNQSISYIRMEGGMAAYGAILVDRRKNVNIHHCEFEDFFTVGVTFSGAAYNSDLMPTVYATGNSFHDNILTNCADYQGSGRTGLGLGNLEIGGQQGMLVYNNTITQKDRGIDSNGYCIKYFGNGYCKGLKIYNNTIVKPQFDGSTWDFSMELWNCRGGIEIYNNNIQGSIDFGGNTSITNDDGGYGFAVKIYQNIIGQPVLRTTEENGIDVERSHTGGFYVYNNLFKNLAATLVMCQGGGDVFKDLYVYYNIFDNLGKSGVASFGNGVNWQTIDDGNITYSNINFINNTINAGSDGNPLAGLRFNFHGNATDITIKNNIIQGFKACPVYMQGSGTITNVSIVNNLFYGNGSSNAPTYGTPSPTNLNYNNNIAANPLFVSSSDYHLQSSSPAIGKGLKNSNITVDRDGNAVSDPPSIGCYEYFIAPLPVYQSSSVENAAPAVLILNYNLSLANIVPDKSSFIVLVNSIARTVNSVTISGTKVQLTLATPVVFGDIVSVSYNKPASSPLQTILGGQASSISSKLTINNCISNIPAYLSSSIENATPSVIGMNYSLSLANVIPAISSFTVQVNSLTRNISTVTISGAIVQLTLANAIKFGDVVTVSYTKPGANPIQSTAGIAAISLSANTVTNNCKDVSKTNEPPVMVVNYPKTVYAGFISEIDATGTYDPNNDPLVAEWNVSNAVSVSAVKSLKTEFLAPVSDTSMVINFELNVSDGSSTLVNVIPVTIVPYKPELSQAGFTNVIASTYAIYDYPKNTIDGKIDTKWSSNGDNQWLIYTLNKPYKIDHLIISFLDGQKYESYFDVYASKDKVNWDHILTAAASCEFSGGSQVFVIPAVSSNTEYSYVKYLAHGNSVNYVNTVSEFKVFGTPSSTTTEISKESIKIYPNPAQNFFNISFEERTIKPNSVRIIDFSGKIVYEETYNQTRIVLPDSLYSGIYIVELRAGNTILNSQKLIIMK